MKLPPWTLKSRLTLDGGLGAGGGDGAHGADHEVGEEHVGAAGALAHVFAEVGDLRGLALALEGALEGGGRGTLEGSGGADGANGPGGGSGAHGGAGSDRNGSHCVGFRGCWSLTGKVDGAERERGRGLRGRKRTKERARFFSFRSRGDGGRGRCSGDGIDGCVMRSRRRGQNHGLRFFWAELGSHLSRHGNRHSYGLWPEALTNHSVRPAC